MRIHYVRAWLCVSFFICLFNSNALCSTCVSIMCTHTQTYTHACYDISFKWLMLPFLNNPHRMNVKVLCPKAEPELGSDHKVSVLDRVKYII